MSAKTGIILKTPQQVEKMKELGSILAEIVANLYELVEVGNTPLDLEKRAIELCREFEVNPSCMGYMGYPAATCIGVNDQAVHNIPKDNKFKDGDIVTIDMVIDQDGWFVDHAVTKGIWNVDTKGRELIENTKKAMEKAISTVKAGKTIGDLGAAMEGIIKPLGFSVLRNYVGHGIGQEMHEEPKIPCFGTPGQGEELKEGMVFTIEPMVAEYEPDITLDSDGWSTRLTDGGRFAMFEHTVALNASGVEILTKRSEKGLF
ncbi:type I methionyl aminopeptidase [Candidatus Dojkabacteria bacterium]|nr:type I methionyl aminopeptidase [Candidatus Dojkabacteria bacterium]